MSTFTDILQEIKQLATTVGTDIKSIFQSHGNLASLKTNDKNSLVQAINEVLTKPDQNNIFLEDLLNLQYTQAGPAFGAIRVNNIKMMDVANSINWYKIDTREACRAVYFALETPSQAVKAFALNWITWCCANFDMSAKTVYDHYVQEGAQTMATTNDGLYIYTPSNNHPTAVSALLVTIIGKYAGLYGTSELPANYIQVVEKFVEINGYNFITKPNGGSYSHDRNIWEDAGKTKRVPGTTSEAILGYAAAAGLLYNHYPDPFNEWHFVYVNWFMESPVATLFYFKYNYSASIKSLYVSLNGSNVGTAASIDMEGRTEAEVAEDIKEMLWPELYGLYNDYDACLVVTNFNDNKWMYGVTWMGDPGDRWKVGLPEASSPLLARALVDRGEFLSPDTWINSTAHRLRDDRATDERYTCLFAALASSVLQRLQQTDKDIAYSLLPVHQGGTGSSTYDQLFSKLGLHADAKLPFVGTNAVSGGAGTGAVLQRGENANGNYIKFKDGTLICWRYVIGRQDGMAADIPAYGFVVHPDWTYPSPFYQDATRMALFFSYHGYGSGFFTIGASNFGATQTSGGIFLCNSRNSGSINGGYVYMMAIGRWY